MPWFSLFRVPASNSRIPCPGKGEWIREEGRLRIACCLNSVESCGVEKGFWPFWVCRFERDTHFLLLRTTSDHPYMHLGHQILGSCQHIINPTPTTAQTCDSLTGAKPSQTLQRPVLPASTSWSSVPTCSRTLGQWQT